MADPFSDIKHVAELIKTDWENLPNILKYSYVGGIFGLILTWIYNIKSFDRAFCFWLSLFLIVAVPIIYWAVVTTKIIYYRRRYPLKKVSKKMLFATTKSASAAIHIIDLDRKQIRWIENGRTAFDLRFYPSAWTTKIELNSFEETIDHKGAKINLTDFDLKSGIRTQGKPGT